MTTRERSLAGLVGVMLGGFIVYAVVDSVFLTPAAEADQALPKLRRDIRDHSDIIAQAPIHEKTLRKYADKTYAYDESNARGAMQEHIGKLAHQSGINTRVDWDILPFSGGGQRGVFQEIGWTINARGSAKAVVNFIHLVQNDPHLHRIQTYNLSRVPKSSDMKISLRYASLVMDPKVLSTVLSEAELKESTPPKLSGYPQLASADRKQYDDIVTRDLFRPYVRRPAKPRPPVKRPDPKPPVKRPDPVKPPRPPDPPAPETLLTIVSLSQFGKPEVRLVHSQTNELTRYTLGEEPIKGWQIAMVDYRRLPHPDNPRILSSSRAIVKEGTTYWAVELGQTLAERRPFEPEHLPAPVHTSAPVVPLIEEVSTSMKDR